MNQFSLCSGEAMNQFSLCSGEAMNQFLNQNADEIIKEMKPVATQTIGRYCRDFLNAAFLKIPIEVWLRDA
jgi:hypothetical protein